MTKKSDYETVYYIKFQWRNPLGHVGNNPKDWKQWRCFGYWPISFKTFNEAWDHMEACNPFQNFRAMNRRKPSCSVEAKRRLKRAS